MKKIYSLLLLAGLCLFGVQNAKADTWTVAGSDAALFGSTWAQAETANDMTAYENGIFIFYKANVSLSEGVIEFKVVKDHAWDEAYPGGNYQFNIPEDGNYNVVITFNSSSTAVNAAFAWTAVGDTTLLFGTNWAPTLTGNDMVYDAVAGKMVWSKDSVVFENAATVQYKVVKNHDWSAGEFPSSGNQSFDFNAGRYNVTIAYDLGSTLTLDTMDITPRVSLSANVSKLNPGETITLTPAVTHFSGTPTYTYSYSTDNGENWTPMAGNTLEAGAAGTNYLFKVVANYGAANETATSATVAVASKVIFHEGTKIYFDARAFQYTLQIYNIPGVASPEADRLAGGVTPEWDNPSVIVIALSQDWDVTDYEYLYGHTTHPDENTWGWNNEAPTVPENNTYTKMLLAADGTYTWQIPVREVILSAGENYLPGETITLMTNTLAFSGEPTIAYSYSTDGGANWTAMAGNTLVAGVSGTAYTFKAVATYNAEEAEGTCQVSVIRMTVAGDPALCGDHWCIDCTNNDMTYADGKFTWSTSNVLLSAGNVQFKLVQNQSWWPTYPTDNYVLAVSKSGYYNVTIELDWATKAADGTGITVTLTPLYPVVKLVGTFTNWETNAIVMEKATDASVWTAANVDLEAGWPGFKVIVGDNWTTHASGSTDLKRSSASSNLTYIGGDDNNMYLKVDVTGKYTFTYNLEDSLLTVSYPESFTRPASANYGSLCVPFDAVLENAYAYQITSQSANTVTITKLNTNLVAGHSYIIKAIDANEDITISKVSEGNVASIPVDDENHFGVLGASITLTEADADAYVLTNNQLCPIGEGGSATIASTKAYFKLPAAAGAPSFRIVEAENNTTGVENIEANGEAVKFFENGQLFILRDGVVYDATGRAVR